MNTWALQIGLFGIVATIIFAIFWLVRRAREADNRRMVQLMGEDDADSLVLGNMTNTLGDASAMDSGTRLGLQQDLLKAGYYRPTALTEYTAVRTVAILVVLFLAGFSVLFVPRSYIPYVAGIGLLAGILAFSVPRVWLGLRARARAKQIERGLPVAVDLLTLGLSAGQTLVGSLERVSQDLRESFPLLAEELDIVTRHADLRSLPHALRLFSDRCQVPEVRNLSVLLTQAERLGTDITTALLEFVSTYRTTLRQRAEAQANRATFWMVFPSLFCLWIPAAVVLLAPVVFEFRKQRSEARTLMDDIRRGVRSAGRSDPSAVPELPTLPSQNR